MSNHQPLISNQLPNTSTHELSGILQAVGASASLPAFVADDQIDDSLIALGKMKPERIAAKYGLTLQAASDFVEKCRSKTTFKVADLAMPTRSRLELSQSQLPDAAALVRIAAKKDASINVLRRGQYEVINSIQNNNDCAAFMPTGGGKSLAWLIHNFLSTERMKRPALTIVVVPFTATIDSHVSKTRKWGSVLSSQDTLETMAQQISTASWLYTTPEKIIHNAKFRWCELLQSQAHRVTLVVYDEAHEWLDTWRAGIQECVDILDGMFPTCCRLACTATCAVADSSILLKRLKMEPSAKVIRCSLDRDNCHLHVVAMTDEVSDMKDMLKKFQQAAQPAQANVFVTSQDQAERFEAKFKELCADAESPVKVQEIASYHSETPKDRKQEILTQFISGALKFVICTSAFGTGIDPPNITLIFHYTLPPSTSAYLQNIGRGGRNGLRYDCYLYFSYRLVHECGMVWFTRRFDSDEELQKRWRDYVAMVRYPLAIKCRRANLLPFFDELYTADSCTTCDVCTLDDETEMQLDITICARLILSVIREFERSEPHGVTLSRVRDVILGLAPRGS